MNIPFIVLMISAHSFVVALLVESLSRIEKLELALLPILMMGLNLICIVFHAKQLQRLSDRASFAELMLRYAHERESRQHVSLCAGCDAPHDGPCHPGAAGQAGALR